MNFESNHAELLSADGSSRSSISRVRLYLCAKKLENPLENPHTSGDSVSTLCCLIDTGDGMTGCGYGWSVGVRRGQVMFRALAALSELIIGQDPLDISRIWGQLDQYSNFFGGRGATRMAMSIIDIALWDIAGIAADVPVWRLLGGSSEDVRVYSSELIDTDASGTASIEEMESQAQRIRAETSSHLKVRLGLRPVDEDLRRLEGLIDRAGSGFTWSVDIAQRWQSHEVIRLQDPLDALGLYWIEDPGHYRDTRGISRVAELYRTPICTGENCYDSSDVGVLLDESSIAYLMLDLQRCGGITGWMTYASAARVRNIHVTPHVYSRIAPSLVAATSNSVLMEYLPWWDFVFNEQVDVSGGLTTPPRSAGLGISFDEDALRQALYSAVIDVNGSKIVEQ